MRRPKPVTAGRVRRWTEWYLDRWSSTERNLERVLWRKAERSLAEHGGDREEVAAWIRAEVDRARALGFVNDEAYARDVVRSQRRRGASRGRIRSRLVAKGVPSDIVEQALAEEDGSSELAAAARFARRRKVGPWRRTPVDDDGRQKELAKLARAGFGYAIARAIVDAESAESLPT